MARDIPSRYEQVASFIEWLVEHGTLVPGDRAPSLRRIARQQRVALSTAVQAYQMLEDMGILEARPKSGYFVCAVHDWWDPPTPQVLPPAAKASKVSIAADVLKLLEYAGNRALVPLGCAIPSASLLAAGRLDRFLSRAARVRGTDSNVYSAPRGELHLRQEIARRAWRSGHALSPDDIAITCGCTEALTLALRAVTRRGDTVAIESPTYFGLLHLLESLELRAFELPTHPLHGIELGALERAVGSGSIGACLLSSSFNNPLGCTMSEDAKTKTLELLYKHEIPLIEDDIYGDIYFGNERPRPFAALDKRGITLYCSSFSKTIAPGYRIGWIATSQRMQTVLERKCASTLCSPVLPQLALADFLNSGGYDNHLRRIRRVFQGNIEHMTRSIRRNFPPMTGVSRPQGGFVLWIELPRPIESRALLELALQEGICFAPGDVFSARRRHTNCLRLSCGSDWNERLRKAVERLGMLAYSLAGHPEFAARPP